MLATGDRYFLEMLTDADALLAGSATDVVLTVTDDGLGTVFGAL
jgi:hypothetical protein